MASFLLYHCVMGATRWWNIDFPPSRYLVGSFAFVKTFPCPLLLCVRSAPYWRFQTKKTHPPTQAHILRKSPYAEHRSLLAILNLKRMNYEKPIRFKHTIFFSTFPATHSGISINSSSTCTFSEVARLTDRRRNSEFFTYSIQYIIASGMSTITSSQTSYRLIPGDVEREMRLNIIKWLEQRPGGESKTIAHINLLRSFFLSSVWLSHEISDTEEDEAEIRNYKSVYILFDDMILTPSSISRCWVNSFLIHYRSVVVRCASV